MAYFIASKCFAAKTGFPNRSCEVARFGSWPSIFIRFTHVLTCWWWTSPTFVWRRVNRDPGQSQRVWESDGFASGPAGEPFSYLYKKLILYSFVKRKEVLIFGYFAEPLGCFCLPVPELLICLKLLCFCFCFLLIEVKILLFLKFLFEFEYFSFLFFNKKPCFKDLVIIYFSLLTVGKVLN